MKKNVWGYYEQTWKQVNKDDLTALYRKSGKLPITATIPVAIPVAITATLTVAITV